MHGDMKENVWVFFSEQIIYSANYVALGFSVVP